MSNASFGVGMNIDHPPTYEEFEDFRGSTLLDYRAPGRALFDEVIEHNGAVYLERNPNGWIDRYAYSTRGCLADLSRGIFYREVAKGRPGGFIIPEEKNHSVSETCTILKSTRIMETYEDALLRCFNEEMSEVFEMLGYKPQKLDLIAIREKNPKPDIHPSSIWANVISHVQYRYFLFILDFMVGVGQSLPPILGQQFIINKDYNGDPAKDERKCVRCYLRADPLDPWLEQFMAPDFRNYLANITKAGA